MVHSEYSRYAPSRPSSRPSSRPPSRSSSRSLTPEPRYERLERLFQEVDRGFDRLATFWNTTTTAPPEVSWQQMPELILTNPGEVDLWFLGFEGRMTAAQVAPSDWARKLMECPGVGPDIQMRIRELGQADYALIRSTILAEDGPTEPVGFFMHALHCVKGFYGEEVSQQLMRLRTLYNRAAGDHGKQALEMRDLLYPFAHAFPPAISQQLQRQLASVAVQPDPYRQLLRQAPVRPLEPLATSVQSSPRSEVLEPNTGPCRAKRPRYEDVDLTELAAALMDQINLQPKPPLQQRRQKRPRPNYVPATNTDFAAHNRPQPRPGVGCPRCGGHCPNRNVCPAFNRACFYCGRIGHFAQMCREADSRKVVSAAKFRRGGRREAPG